MIPLELQDELKKRLEIEFEHFRLKNIKGETTKLNVFTQHLPTKSKNDVSPFPYALIRLSDGSQEDNSESRIVKVLFIVGVVDRDNSNQGYRDAVNVTQRIYENITRNPIINNQFELAFPINWAYHDEDAEPYYFVGLETNWQIPKTVREDWSEMV